MAKKTPQPGVPTAPPPTHGFLVKSEGDVPAIGTMGASSQMICPLMKGPCLKQLCMFWVELFSSPEPNAPRVAHCAYYWNALHAVEIKEALFGLNRLVRSLVPPAHAPAPPAS